VESELYLTTCQAMSLLQCRWCLAPLWLRVGGTDARQNVI